MKKFLVLLITSCLHATPELTYWLKKYQDEIILLKDHTLECEEDRGSHLWILKDQGREYQIINMNQWSTSVIRNGLTGDFRLVLMPNTMVINARGVAAVLTRVTTDDTQNPE